MSLFRMIPLFLFMCTQFSYACLAETKDCSEAYGQPATCKITGCNNRHKNFIGTWRGPFLSYSRELSTATNVVFRPFDNTVTYSEKDCLENIENHDIFIIGRRIDVYPEFKGLSAKKVSGLLITGKRNDGTLFLRTVDQENGVNEFKLEYRNTISGLTAWSFSVPQTDNNPEMRFTTIDAQDQNQQNGLRMNVTVTMSIGAKDMPDWEGIVTKGYHSLIKN